MNRRILGAAALDGAAIVAFAVVGRREHDGGTTTAGVLGVAAPFLIGAAAGWLIVLGRRREPASWPAGVTVWAATLVVGLPARRLVWDRGIAPSFVVVTAVVLGVLMFGWRALYVFGAQRQQIRSPAPPSKADR